MEIINTDRERHFLQQLTLHEKVRFYEELAQYCLDRRKELLDNIIESRTKRVTVVLENIYQSQNASATLRTSEIMGVQDVHIIENEHEYTLNPDVVIGSAQWIHCRRYNELENNTKHCLNQLKQDGYLIAATLPNENCISIEDIDISKKIAFVFGNEKTGLSDIAIEAADVSVKIPMFGFTESYNISVSVALCLYELMQRLRKSDIDWRLSEDEKYLEKILWAKQSINKNPDMLFDAVTRKLFPEYAEKR